MKKLLTILFILIAYVSYGQYAPMQAYGYMYKRIVQDSTAHIPSFCGVPTLRNSSATKKSAVAVDTCNKRLYFYDGKTQTWDYAGSTSFDTTAIYNAINNIIIYLGDTSFTSQFMPFGILTDTAYYLPGSADSIRRTEYTDGTVVDDTLGPAIVQSILNNITNILNILDSARSDTSFYISTILNGTDTLLKVIHIANSRNDTIVFNLPHADATHAGYVSAGGSANKILHGDGIFRDTTAVVGSSVTPAALTKTDDTNVTLTLGGTPSTALLQATSLTLGWTGNLAATRGGTGTATVTTGDLLYGSGANTWSKLPIGTTGQKLVVVGGLPVWRDTTAASGGVISLAAIGSVPNANAATISGSTLNLQKINASFGGVLTTGYDSIAGAKNFQGRATNFRGHTPLLTSNSVPSETAITDLSTRFNFPYSLDWLPTGELAAIFYNNSQDGGKHPYTILARSTDQGQTWPLKDTILTSPNDTAYSGGAAGLSPSGRMFVFYVRTDTIAGITATYNMAIKWSDDYTTWSPDILISGGSNTRYLPCGKLQTIAGDTLMFTWYGFDGTNYSSYATKSGDNGVTWGNSITILTSTTNQISEVHATYLGGRAILGHIRTENGSSMPQVLSTDNGTTWVNQGNLTMLEAGIRDMSFLSTIVTATGERYVEAIYTNRVTTKKLFVVYGKASKLIASGTAGWDLATKVNIATGAGGEYYSNPVVAHKEQQPAGLIATFYWQSAALAPIRLTRISPNFQTIPILMGDPASGGNLILYSTPHATKGKIVFGTSVYDELTNRLAIAGGVVTPNYPLEVYTTVSAGSIQTSGEGNANVGISAPGISFGNASTTGNPFILGGATNKPLLFLIYGGGGVNVERWRMTTVGLTNLLAAPTAQIHLKAQTNTASTAPIKLTSGSIMTTPENGAIEYDGTNYFVTSASVRTYLARTLTNTATLDFGSTAAQTSATLTITVTGVAVDEAVFISVPTASVNANSNYTAYVSATNTVTVVFNNYSSGAIDPASGSFRAVVIKY